MSTVNSKFYIETTQSPIYVKSIEAVKIILKKIVNNYDIPIVGTTYSSDINRELGRVTQDVKDYPYFMIYSTQIESNNDSYNKFSLKKYGTNPISEQPKQLSDFYYNYHLIPVLHNLSVKYYSQSFEDILSFCSNWMYNAREGTITLTTKNNFKIDITVVLGSSLSYPEKDFSEGKPYCVESSINLYTYVGDIYRIPTIKTVKNNIEIVNNFEIEDF